MVGTLAFLRTGVFFCFSANASCSSALRAMNKIVKPTTTFFLVMADRYNFVVASPQYRIGITFNPSC